jgi:hypothetical protein
MTASMRALARVLPPQQLASLARSYRLFVHRVEVTPLRGFRIAVLPDHASQRLRVA